MSLKIRQSSRFKRDIKRIRKRRLDMARLEFVIRTLVNEDALEAKYRDHILSGNWQGYRECQIQPDWLLIYRVNKEYLELVRTGTHSDLF